MEFAVRSPLVLTERNPFVTTVVRPEILAVQLPVKASAFPENSAMPVWQHWLGEARRLTGRTIQLLLDFVFRAARGDARPTAWI